MGDAKQYSERDLIEAKRETWVACALVWTNRGEEMAREDARVRFPLPKVERPRIVVDCEDKDVSWRFYEGRLQWHDDRDGTGWWGKAAFAPTLGRVELWAALLASPTELVDEAPASSSIHQEEER